MFVCVCFGFFFGGGGGRGGGTLGRGLTAIHIPFISGHMHKYILETLIIPTHGTE